MHTSWPIRFGSIFFRGKPRIVIPLATQLKCQIPPRYHHHRMPPLLLTRLLLHFRVAGMRFLLLAGLVRWVVMQRRRSLKFLHQWRNPPQNRMRKLWRNVSTVSWCQGQMVLRRSHRASLMSTTIPFQGGRCSNCLRRLATIRTGVWNKRHVKFLQAFKRLLYGPTKVSLGENKFFFKLLNRILFNCVP